MEKIDIPRFVKWAGGKKQLLEQFKDLYPKSFNGYFEPFLGSGAVAFYIIETFKPEKILLSDINEELINAFNIVKTHPEELISLLKKHKAHHTEDAKKYYYEIRKIEPNSLQPLERAARFIYLNRTCFNGLYRVNAKGKFNVPMGSYKNPDIVQEKIIKKASDILRKDEIKVMSFEKVLELAKNGDFIYFDPPYYPLKKGISFTTYAQGNFLEKEQEKLAEVFKQLDKKGCYCMLSNSDTEFIKNLYSDFKIHTVKASRMINSKSTGRGAISEIVVTNY
jgi:DNA adenine methylase